MKYNTFVIIFIQATYKNQEQNNPNTSGVTFHSYQGHFVIFYIGVSYQDRMRLKDAHFNNNNNSWVLNQELCHICSMCCMMTL